MYIINTIKKQLNREPRGYIGVGSYCQCGAPNVIKSKPFLNNCIFPTFLYITCKKLNQQIGKLESTGYMKYLNNELYNNALLQTQYQLSYEHYIDKRNEFGIIFNNPGVGGMPNTIKCLHALVAYSLTYGKGINCIGDKCIKKLNKFNASYIQSCV